MPSCPACQKPLPRGDVLCVHCGYDRRLGRRIIQSPMPSHLTPPVAPELSGPILAPPVATPKHILLPWHEFGAPVTTTILALLLLIARAFVFPPDRMAAFWLGAFLDWFLNSALLVGAVVVAGRWGAVEFGEVPRGVLKCSAIALATLTCVAWLPSDVRISTWLTGVPALASAISIVVPLVIRLIVPLVVLRYFFDLDLFELVLLVFAQWLVSLLLAPILGLLIALF